MKEIIKYEAIDGKIFDTKCECEKYETTFKEMIHNARIIKKYCKGRYCGSCVFSTEFETCILNSDDPENWDLPE